MILYYCTTVIVVLVHLKIPLYFIMKGDTVFKGIKTVTDKLWRKRRVRKKSLPLLQ